MKKLKKKKLQFAVIGIILCLAATILTTCLSFSEEVDRYIEKQYQPGENAALMVYVTKGTTDYLKKALDDNKEISNYTTYQCFQVLKTPLKHKDTLVRDYINPLYAIVIDDKDTLPFHLTSVKGDTASKAPNKGQVWVQNIVAENHDIHTSDNFLINDTSLTVSTLVNDTRKPVSMTTGASIFISKEDTTYFSSDQELELLCIHSDAKSEELQSWLDARYSDTFYSVGFDALSDMKLKASLMTILISKLGSASAMFMFAVTLVIILFFIRSTILAEYNAIGIYKSVGFSTSKIMGFYVKAYALVGIVSITIGAFLGLPLSTVIGDIVMKYIGEYHLTRESFLIVIRVIVITCLTLIGCVFLALLRIRKISPVDAIAAGKKSTKAKLKKSLIKHAHSSFSMAINDSFKYKGRSSIIIVVVTLSFYIAILLLNMCLSFDRMETNAPGWVSMPDSDCFVGSDTQAISDDLVSRISTHPDVESYITGSLLSNVRVTPKDDSINLKYANVLNFNTYDFEKTGISYLNGRPPENKQEVAINTATLKDTGYGLGDTITLGLNGTEADFMITGIYDTMMTPSISLTSDALSALPKDAYQNVVGVHLKDSDQLDDFRKQMETEFPEFKVSTMLDVVDNVKVSVMQIMVPVTLIIIVMFFSFTLLNIINLILTNNNEQKTNFGILKAFGFTTGYIIRRNVIRIMLLSSIGLGISLVLDLVFNKHLFHAILGVNAYITNLPETCLLLVISFLVILALSILLSLSIRKITPKELMEQ
ncbi:MAG: ABC transporter permease [bacterium]|nr:ABC transporter permease [bacterium]